MGELIKLASILLPFSFNIELTIILLTQPLGNKYCVRPSYGSKAAGGLLIGVKAPVLDANEIEKGLLYLLVTATVKRLMLGTTILIVITGNDSTTFEIRRHSKTVLIIRTIYRETVVVYFITVLLKL